MHAHNSLLYEYSTSCLCTTERDVFPPVFGVWGFPGGSDGKASACNAGDPGSIPGSEISPGEENGNPLQYSCLENSMDGGAWWAAVHGVAKSDFTSLTFGVYE